MFLTAFSCQASTFTVRQREPVKHILFSRFWSKQWAANDTKKLLDKLFSARWQQEGTKKLGQQAKARSTERRGEENMNKWRLIRGKKTMMNCTCDGGLTSFLALGRSMRIFRARRSWVDFFIHTLENMRVKKKKTLSNNSTVYTCSSDVIWIVIFNQTTTDQATSLLFHWTAYCVLCVYLHAYRVSNEYSTAKMFQSTLLPGGKALYQSGPLAIPLPKMDIKTRSEHGIRDKT